MRWPTPSCQSAAWVRTPPAGALAVGALVLALGGTPAAGAAAADLGRHVEALSSVGSRVTGYPGCRAAAEYLDRELAAAGVQERYRQVFAVPVPVDRGAQLVLGSTGESLPLACMWPNMVRPPTTGGPVEGSLVYGGRGEPGGLDGADLSAAIVVYEYDCGRQWLTAFELGAAAVVFLEPQSPEAAHRWEGERKFLGTPAHLPRFLAAGPAAQRLRASLGRGERARLEGRMDWELARPEALFAVIDGTDPELRQRAVVITCYYDAISPAPALAPGAEQAAGAAAWLELARNLARHPRRRTAVMVATPGHFQALAGMRAVMNLLHGELADGSGIEGPAAGGLRQRLGGLELDYVLGLDLTSRGDHLALVQGGDPFRVRQIPPPLFDRVAAIAARYESEHLAGAIILGGDLRPLRERRLAGLLPERIPTQGAVAALAGHLGLTLVTAGDERASFDSPLDLPDRVELVRLARQASFVEALVGQLLDDGGAARHPEPARDSFGTLSGRVVRWGQGSFQPDAPVAGALVRVRALEGSAMGVRADPLTLTDADGRFAVAGLESGTLYLKPRRLEAYHLDGESGEVDMAVDLGPFGAGQFPAEVLMDRPEEDRTLVVFPCRPLALLDLHDPRYLVTPAQLRLLDPAGGDLAHFGTCAAVTRSEVQVWGHHDPLGPDVETAAVVFAPPERPVVVTASAGQLGTGLRLALVNSAPGRPTGSGYGPGRGARLIGTGHRAAADLVGLNRGRLEQLERHGIRNRSLRGLHERSRAQLEAAEAASRAGDHGAFLDRSRRAWALASRAHGAIRGLGQDAVHGVLLFLLLSLPGAVLAERLLLAAPGVRGQVAGAASIYLVLFGALRVSHPAFEMSLYPLMILVAFLVLALSLAVTAIGLRQLSRQLHHSLSSAVALHRPDTRRAGMAARALLLGVAQMRRRPLRTGLTCATLVLVTFSLASFTSVRTALRTNRVALGPPDPGLGDGLLVRLPAWQGLEGSAGPALARRLGEDQVVARWWYLREAAIERDGRTAAVKALLGLEAREPEHSRVDRALVAGRWLNPGETGACLLPEGRARELGIGPGEVGVAQVRILGAPYRVVGLLDAARLDAVRDLGGAPLTPLDVDAQQPDEPRLGWARAGGLAAFSHLPAAQLAVLPAAAVARWGEWARLAAVSVRLPPGGGETTVNELAEELGLNLFAALDGQRYLVNTVGVQVFAGRGELWVPLVIAGLIVLNTMLGSVYERLPEIATLNAVGLAPVHVSGLFLAEAVAYAVLSGVAGYLLGQGVARVGLVYGLFPGLTVNYSSLSTAATVAAVMAVVVASAAYPAHLAARVCVPGVERAWRLPRPRGDALDLPMPFSLGPAEARGLLAFLAEYLELYGEQSIGAPFCAEGVRAALGTCSARVWLAPYDQGISQRVTVAAAPEAGGRFWSMAVRLERASGPAAGWLRANRLFVDGLRRQFLAWRALSPQQRAAYLAAAPAPPLEGAP